MSSAKNLTWNDCGLARDLAETLRGCHDLPETELLNQDQLPACASAQRQF